MPRFLPARRNITILLVTTVLFGCARVVPIDDGSPERESEQDRAAKPAVLHIRNNHWSDVTVWALTGGQRNRVGTVSATTVAEFVLPRSAMNRGGEMRLVATALASHRPHISEVIVVRPGGIVEWTLESQLERSFLSVY